MPRLADGAGGLLFAGVVVVLTAGLSIGPATGQRATSQPAPPDPASVFDEVDECDLLAAHPADPQRVAEGVAETAIIPRLAVRACEAAARRSPAETRFVYQLGRAFEAANRAAEARAQYDRAAQANYAAAIAARADLQLSPDRLAVTVMETLRRELNRTPTEIEVIRALHRVSGDMADQHRLAERAGFTASRARADALKFDASIYAVPILGQIGTVSLDAAAASAQAPEVRAYLYSFLTNLMGQCGPVMDATSVAALAIFRFGGSISADQEDAPRVAVQPLIAEVDAQRFVRRHGCDGPVTEGFIATVALFLLQQARR